jgi:hypothetical protein
MSGKWRRSPESAVKAPKRPNDLRVRKPSGPGSHHRDAANLFSPNKNDLHQSDRSARFEPTDGCVVTAVAHCHHFAGSIRRRQPAPLTSRFTARKPLYPAESSGIR